MSTLTANRCPHCAVELHSGGAIDVDMFGCSRCCGVWIDNRGCQRMLDGSFPAHAREQIRNSTERQAAGERPTDYRTLAHKSDRGCPVCAEPLVPHSTTLQQHGVVVHLDVCAPHGTWFDQGEAWSLLQAVELKKLALLAEIQADLRAREEADGTAAWSQFLDGILSG